MDTIFISNLVVEAHIGVTAHERDSTQRLAIALELEVDLADAALSDSLRDTINYSVIKKEVEQIVYGSRCVLLEKLAHEIITLVLSYDKVFGVTVEISKLDVWKNAVPGVRLHRSVNS